MRRIPLPQDGDKLTGAYLQELLGSVWEEFLRFRRSILPTGLHRPLGSQHFNEHLPMIERIMCRAPLTVLVACPAIAGIAPDGNHLQTDAFECDVVLPPRGDFTLHLVPAAPTLPKTPVASPVLVEERFTLSTRAGLKIARGTVGPDLTPTLDPNWIAPTVTTGGSRAVYGAVKHLRQRLQELDRRLLTSACTEQARTLLQRWTAFYASWRALGDMTALDDHIVHTSRFLAQMWSDTTVIFGVAPSNETVDDDGSLAWTFRHFTTVVDGLAKAWEGLLQVPMTAEIPLKGTPTQSPAGNHTEIIIRTQQQSIPFAEVQLTAQTASPFGPEVSPVCIDLSASRATLTARTHLIAPVPGTVTCRFSLTPEERAQGRLRLFIRRELVLSAFTLTGV